MALNYSAPPDSKSAIDRGGNSNQMRTHWWLRKSLTESRKEQFFMPLADVQNMPKHFGKTIKLYEYVPLLDDRNVNDQGIDANGVTMVPGTWDAYNAAGERVADGAGADSNGSYPTEAAAWAAAGAGGRVQQNGGNLYGSSKDIGTITGKLPLLSEHGGRVNRVGFTRLQLEGSIHKFGMFYEWTQESMDFDSDDELAQHLARELMNGAVQLTEAVLQQDLLSAAGTVIYAGTAINDEQITGEEGAGGEPPSVMSYRNLMRLDQTLTDLRTPKHTKVITGSRMIDTKTIPACRVAYVGSELVPLLREMKDLFGNPAFIPVQHYANAAGNTLNGEIGSIDSFRIIQVPEMLHWAGAGAAVEDSDNGYRTTTVNGVERFNVYPFFVVGSESFTTIGFQTDGKSFKFNIITKKPGRETAGHWDPYGEKGFSSIKWYYGVLIKRPERLAMIKTVAPI